MSGILSKITRHAKKQENAIYNEKKNQSMETDPEIIQLAELVEQDIKRDIINSINTHHMFKNVEKSMYMIGRKIKDTNWISTNKICNVCDENYSRQNQQQIRRKINEPESIKTKTPKMNHRKKKKKRLWKSKSISELGNNCKQPSIHVI